MSDDRVQQNVLFIKNKELKMRKVQRSGAVAIPRHENRNE